MLCKYDAYIVLCMLYNETWALPGGLALKGLQESLQDVEAHLGYEPSFRLGPPRAQTLGSGGVCDQVALPGAVDASRTGAALQPLVLFEHYTVTAADSHDQIMA